MPVTTGWCCGESIVVEPAPKPECGIKSCTGLLPEMISIDEFLPELQFHAVNAPDDFLRFSLLAAAGEIAERTHLLQRTIIVPVYGNVQVYPWAGGEDERPVALRGYELYDADGNILAGQDPETRRGYGGERARVRELPSRAVEIDTCDLCPCGHARLFYSVAPTRTACMIDSLFFHDWQPAVQAGALARVFATPGSAAQPYPFFSPAMAREYERQFIEEIARISMIAQTRRERTNGMFSIIPEEVSRCGI